MNSSDTDFFDFVIAKLLDPNSVFQRVVTPKIREKKFVAKVEDHLLDVFKLKEALKDSKVKAECVFEASLTYTKEINNIGDTCDVYVFFLCRVSDVYLKLPFMTQSIASIVAEQLDLEFPVAVVVPYEILESLLDDFYVECENLFDSLNSDSPLTIDPIPNKATKGQEAESSFAFQLQIV